MKVFTEHDVWQNFESLRGMVRESKPLAFKSAGFRAMLNEYENTVLSSEEEIDASNEHNGQLRVRNDRLATTLTQARIKIDKLEENLKADEGMFDMAYDTVKRLRDLFNARTVEKEELGQELDDVAQDLIETALENEKWRKRAQYAEERCVELCKQLGDLRNRNDELVVENAEVNAEATFEEKFEELVQEVYGTHLERTYPECSLELTLAINELEAIRDVARKRRRTRELGVIPVSMEGKP